MLITGMLVYSVRDAVSRNFIISSIEKNYFVDLLFCFNEMIILPCATISDKILIEVSML